MSSSTYVVLRLDHLDLFCWMAKFQKKVSKILKTPKNKTRTFKIPKWKAPKYLLFSLSTNPDLFLGFFRFLFLSWSAAIQVFLVFWELLQSNQTNQTLSLPQELKQTYALKKKVVGRWLSFLGRPYFQRYDVNFGEDFGHNFSVMTDSLSGTRLAKLISNEICLPLRHQIVAKPRLCTKSRSKKEDFFTVIPYRWLLPKHSGCISLQLVWWEQNIGWFIWEIYSVYSSWWFQPPIWKIYDRQNGFIFP